MEDISHIINRDCRSYLSEKLAKRYPEGSSVCHFDLYAKETDLLSVQESPGYAGCAAFDLVENEEGEEFGHAKRAVSAGLCIACVVSMIAIMLLLATNAIILLFHNWG